MGWWKVEVVSDTLARVQGLIEDELLGVERRMTGVVASKTHIVPSIYHHALKGGGKKTRPTLVILSARLAANSRYDELDHGPVIDFAAAAEMVHVASLLHDDVADEAVTRRGLPAANQLWRRKLCVFVADYIMAAAYAWMSAPHTARHLQILSSAIEDMCEAEILQSLREGDLLTTEEDYFAIVRGKTGSLMSACCRIGGLLGQASEAEADKLAEFGMSFGCAFQLTDDLLDLLASREETGKERGSDLRAGRLTLPLIHTLSMAGRDDAAWLVEQLQQPEQFTDGKLERVVRLAIDCGAVDSCRQSAANMLSCARDILHEFEPCQARQALWDLCDFLLNRRK